jgi:hypothetical protein
MFHHIYKITNENGVRVMTPTGDAYTDFPSSAINALNRAGFDQMKEKKKTFVSTHSNGKHMITAVCRANRQQEVISRYAVDLLPYSKPQTV